MRFAPFASCPDAAFFTELARMKLHEFKLDDRPVPIRATFARARADVRRHPLPTACSPAGALARCQHARERLRACSLQVAPSLFVGSDAFAPSVAGSVPPALCVVPGMLRNANTIDDFKDWDKALMSMPTA